ncbi:NCS2 family permease [Hansschlegelia sp.]|uniref:NCS2 family permease n=1 Tax=Hansschlegelia sp. TaxID=2041892 RepID=UPI002CBD3DED|nr:NCS2 family permease [Hansschlegelia sp.]HVI28367.1 NCS2 family permease [Hansschlegelia sp.]
MLERIFALRAHGTTVRTEMLAGLTTFLTMAYIAFVNPEILGAAGVPKEAAFVATCLAAAFGSLLMAFLANAPVAIAPGMGLNAFFAYVVVVQMHYTWQAALGCVFLSGCLFILVTVTGVREAVVGGVPRSLRIAITAGIGLFLAIIALKSAGLIAASPATFVTLGDLHAPGVILAVLGFLCVAGLSARGFSGALLTAILAVTALSFLFAGNVFRGVFAAPPSLAPTLFALDIRGALAGGLVNVILVFFLVELFDATGTLIAVARRVGLTPEQGNGRLGRALLADSLAIPVGALLGTSSPTAYLESAAGAAAGGRTGLTAVTVAALFLLCLFFAPLAGAAPPYATAPALLYVACLMLRDIAELDWDDVTEWAPACVAALAMPFTYSIANGVAFGFICYAALKLVTGRAREAKPVVWVVAALFLLRYALMPAG